MALDLLTTDGRTLLISAVSFWLCLGLVVIAPWVPRLCGRPGHLSAVQASHSRPTPRVGGIAIFGAFGVSVLCAPAEVSWPYLMFFLASTILFVAGLIEDLGFGVAPRRRLAAVCLASLTVIWLLGVWLPRLDIPGLDALMPVWIVGIPVTLLMTAAVANGFNLIDGVNGLAAMTAGAAAVALGLIAGQADYLVMVALAGMLAAGILGFLLLNYPFGLIFLGDAGAYTLGFVLSWFGIAILLNVPEASPWAILLTVFWPLADTLLAILRRSRRNVAAMAADRLHVHHLVMRALEIYVLGRDRRHIANPLTTLVLAPFVLAPPLAGVLLWDRSLWACVAVLGFTGLFFGSYGLAFVVLRRLPRRRWSAAEGLPAGRGKIWSWGLSGDADRS